MTRLVRKKSCERSQCTAMDGRAILSRGSFPWVPVVNRELLSDSDGRSSDNDDE